jgi:hypothetical protein
MFVSIDQLHLTFTGIPGHVHRVNPIAQRALALLRLRLRDQLLASSIRLEELSIASLIVPPLELDMRTMSDEGAAEKLADVMYGALLARWQEG